MSIDRIKNSLQIWWAIRWFTFARWFAMKMARTYYKRRDNYYAAEWYKRSRDANRYLGIALAKQVTNRLYKFGFYPCTNEVFRQKED